MGAWRTRSHSKHQPRWLHWDYSSAAWRQKLAAFVCTCTDINFLFLSPPSRLELLLFSQQFSWCFAVGRWSEVLVVPSCPRLLPPAELGARRGTSPKQQSPEVLQLGIVHQQPWETHQLNEPLSSICPCGKPTTAKCLCSPQPSIMASPQPWLLGTFPAPRPHSAQRGWRNQQDFSSPDALSSSQEQTSPSMAASVPSIFLLAAKLLISCFLL